MPLKLKAENKDLETALDIVEFISKTEENSPYFRVKNLDNVAVLTWECEHTTPSVLEMYCASLS